MELSFPCTFAPRNKSSIDGTFRSLELLFPRTFISGSESDVELSFPGTFVPTVNVMWFPNPNYDYLIVKLMVLRHYSFFVSLNSFIVVNDDRT